MSNEPSGKKAYPRNSEKTRDRILKAAISLFSHASYDKVRSRDIAQLAGVDVALINRYFGSKKELFIAVLEFFAHSGPKLNSEDLPQRFYEDFSLLLSGERLRKWPDGLNFIMLSSQCPEVSPLLGDFMKGTIRSIAERLGHSDCSTATALVIYILGAHLLFRLLDDDDRLSLRQDILLEPLRILFESASAGEQEVSETNNTDSLH